MVCELVSQQCNSGRCVLGCLTSAWNTKITLHQSLGINYWKCNVIVYIKNCFRINYVIIFCPMVNLSVVDSLNLAENQWKLIKHASNSTRTWAKSIETCQKISFRESTVILHSSWGKTTLDFISKNEKSAQRGSFRDGHSSGHPGSKLRSVPQNSGKSSVLVRTSMTQKVRTSTALREFMFPT